MRKEVVVAAVTVTTAAAAVAAMVLVRHWKRQNERSWRHAKRILRKFARESATPVTKLWLVANDLAVDMQTGLISEQSKLGMFPFYSGSLPTGDEKGVYYGINLRGDNFLILRAQLGGKNEILSEFQREEVQIPSRVISADSKELFDLIALELSKFVSLHEDLTGKTKLEKLKLGFTISPPVDQAAASSCRGIDWRRLTDDTVRTQMMTEINEALLKHGVEMQVSAMVDEVIGCLAGARYYSRESVAALSLGMAVNAAYMESVQEVQKLQGQLSNSGEMAISVNWGNFSSIHLPMTEFDASLDSESTNPGSGIFEKLISGMYLGEIVRKVLLKMAQEAALFGDNLPIKLTIPYLLRSHDVAIMHQDTSEDYEMVDEKLKEIFEISNTTPVVREIVAEVCDIVAERGARLVGAGIMGIVKKLGRIANKKSVITVEGGLYEHYRIFRNYLHSSVWEMLGSDLSDNVIIEHSHGGSGAGALFIAASQTRDADS
ncbi:probable hexokinase-like 2 protein [Coffea arabica]|uniref:Phosphotransferase n=1 Tax=Coffea arabica TaxID=13443 RepID=A0A6P6TI45_COFAR|nr:probable hexokinase-like 2 protein isoform X4 [Coffea arabica]